MTSHLNKLVLEHFNISSLNNFISLWNEKISYWKEMKTMKIEINNFPMSPHGLCLNINNEHFFFHKANKIFLPAQVFLLYTYFSFFPLITNAITSSAHDPLILSDNICVPEVKGPFIFIQRTNDSSCIL